MRSLFFPLGGIVLIFLSVAVIIYVNTNFFKINRVCFCTGKIPQGKTIKVLQIADLHNKFFDKNNRRLLQKVQQEEPDLIAITGDFIDARTKNFSETWRLGKKLTEICQVFFVTGNHEWRNRNGKKFVQGLGVHGVQVLDNQNKIISFQNVKINIAGAADYSSRHGDIEIALSRLNKNHFVLLLSHDPMIIKKDFPKVDLIISGHTHGGQIRIPLIGALILPGHSSLSEYDRGVFCLPNGGSLYIDSGLGTSVLPIRFWCQAQISLITLSGTGR